MEAGPKRAYHGYCNQRPRGAMPAPGGPQYASTVDEQEVLMTIPTLPKACKAANRLRFVTAASLFDGHDASINIMRRILQAMGCEVIHLGHNRSVEEIVDARCRRTCRASPSAPTRAATSSTSST
jgi:hypothetical protein